MRFEFTTERKLRHHQLAEDGNVLREKAPLANQSSLFDTMAS
jgi:hypothetical protein